MKLVLLLTQPNRDDVRAFVERIRLSGLQTAVLTDSDFRFTRTTADGDSVGVFPADDTVYLSDRPDCLARLCSADACVIGYEHDGLALSCPEIVESLSSLTADYLTSVFALYDTRTPVISDETMALCRVSGQDFFNYFECCRREPYCLTPDERRYTDADCSELFRYHRMLSSVYPFTGTFRILSHGAEIGYIGIFPQDLGVSDETEFTIDFLIHPDFRSRGFGTGAVRLMLRYLAAQSGLKTVYARVHRDNLPSLTLLRNCSFSLVGELPEKKTDCPVRPFGDPPKCHASDTVLLLSRSLSGHPGTHIPPA